MANGFIRLLLIVGVLVLAIGSSHLHAKDLGMTYGQTTPAFAMYLAQMKFANDRCVTSGLTKDVDSAKLLTKRFGNITSASVYSKKDEEFPALIERFHSYYDNAWNSSDQASREAFCAGFDREVAQCREGCLRWAMPILYLRKQLTPLSKDASDRAKSLASIASTVGVVASSAANISASNQSLSSAKAGDFGGASQALAEGQAWGQFASVAGAAGATAVRERIVTSVLEVEEADGRVTVVSCPVIDHFSQFDAPPEAGIWLTYHPVSARCRDVTAADIPHMRSRGSSDGS